MWLPTNPEMPVISNRTARILHDPTGPGPGNLPRPPRFPLPAEQETGTGAEDETDESLGH
jgi:hypothetical protein